MGEQGWQVLEAINHLEQEGASFWRGVHYTLRKFSSYEGVRCKMLLLYYASYFLR